MALLAAIAGHHGVAVTAVPPVVVDGLPCSSTRVRAAVAAGDLGGAARLLGAPFALEGVVRPGARRGRELGFPTANIGRFGRRALVPPAGIYAVTATYAGAGGRAVHPAVASLGTNPTFAGTAQVLEVFLLDGAHDLYGRRLEVGFLERLRDERRFPSVAALVAQMHEDCAAARRAHARAGPGADPATQAA
jgi:riboflavin kinase/FMN adenylyltransferase